MNAHTIKIEWEEDGCWLVLDLDVEIPLHTDEGRLRVRLEDPEALYNACRADILPWLYERDQALATFRTDPASPGFAGSDPEDGYDLSDPKHPRFHSVHVDHWDNRDKTVFLVNDSAIPEDHTGDESSRWEEEHGPSFGDLPTGGRAF